MKPENLEEATQEVQWNFNEIEELFNEEMAVQEAKRCLSCNHFCEHCQDFPAIYSDLTAGEVGSQKGFTTVVTWTERGKEILNSAIKKGYFEQGKVNLEELKEAIILKSQRELAKFEKTPRQQVLDYITKHGTSTISEMSKELKIDSKKVRYEALRLSQLNEVEMQVDSEKGEPVFTLSCD